MIEDKMVFFFNKWGQKSYFILKLQNPNNPLFSSFLGFQATTFSRQPNTVAMS